MKGDMIDKFICIQCIYLILVVRYLSKSSVKFRSYSKEKISNIWIDSVYIINLEIVEFEPLHMDTFV